MMKLPLNFPKIQKHVQGQDPHNHRFHTIVRGQIILVDENLISLITGIPKGRPWDKDDRALNNRAKISFFRSCKEYEENKNGIKRESLPYEWGEVAYHIMKYLTYEGRFRIVYASYFLILD